MTSVRRVLIGAFAALPFAVACTTGGASGPPSAQPSILAGTTWRLAEITSAAGGPVRPDDPAKYEMTLGPDGHVSMRLDCNRAVGGWSGNDHGQFRFTQLAMTRAACLPGSLDDQVSRATDAVRTYDLRADELRLGMDGGGYLIWRRAPSP